MDTEETNFHRDSGHHLVYKPHPDRNPMQMLMKQLALLRKIEKRWSGEEGRTPDLMLGNDEKGQKTQVSVEKNPYFSMSRP